MPNTESNTSNYKTGRIPVIALDYSSRQLAEKRELLVDYKNAKLYVVSAEDKTVIYDITDKIVQTFKESGDISDFTVEVECLGTYKLGDVISKIYLARIDLIEDKEFQYNAPTTSFDNNSIAIYDRQASLVNFNTANDRTVPMKVDGYLQWKNFDIETLNERVAAIEAAAPPDESEFAKFRERLAAVEATDALYKDLPNMKTQISSNTANILSITNELTKFNELNDIKDNISNLSNQVTSHTAKIKADEAKLDVVSTKTNANDTTLQLLEERANTNAALLTSLLTRTSKLENIDAANRLSTAENEIININTQLKSIASTDTVNDLDDRLHNVEDNYSRDMSSITNDISSIKSKITGYDKDIPTLKTKVSSLETSIASLSGIDIDQINNNIDQKINSIKQTVDSYNSTNASMQTLVDQLKNTVDSYSSSITALQTQVENIDNDKYLKLSGGTLTGDITGTNFHGNSDTATTIKNINSKPTVYGTSRLVIADSNGEMNTINGITYAEDSLTIPTKVVVNDISCQAITAIQTSLKNKLSDAPIELDTADKLFNNIIAEDDRNTVYDIQGSNDNGVTVAKIDSRYFKDKMILYIDKTDNKLKVFNIEAITEIAE